MLDLRGDMASNHLVVDGSNIATEGRAAPAWRSSTTPCARFLDDRSYDNVTVVVDATFGHRIDPSESAAYEEAILAGELLTPPAGAIGRGDAFILQIAEQGRTPTSSPTTRSRSSTASTRGSSRKAGSSAASRCRTSAGSSCCARRCAVQRHAAPCAKRSRRPTSRCAPSRHRTRRPRRQRRSRRRSRAGRPPARSPRHRAPSCRRPPLQRCESIRRSAARAPAGAGAGAGVGAVAARRAPRTVRRRPRRAPPAQR